VSGATVTPSGVREGDPAALAALCAVRGPSVLAYCRQVAGEAEAGLAAAEAFARFRVAVVAAGDTSTLNPEALLISATRTSAAAHARTTAMGHCAAVPSLLAARAEKTIGEADLQRLEAHLAQCWACRAPVARFKAAERAYRDPPEKTIEPALAAQIVDALIAAVPPPPPPEPAAASPNGASPLAAEAPPADPHATQSFTIEQAAEHFAAPDPLDADVEAGAAAETDVAADAAPRRPRRPRRRSRNAGVGALLSRLRPLRPGSGARGPRQPPLPGGRAEPVAAAAAEPREDVAAPPPLLDPGVLRERRERSRSGLRLAVVLPIVLVLLALLGALYIAGVFGGKEPASSPAGVTAPAAAAGDTTGPELVAVPGAKDASADAVESAKARERARERGEAGTAKRSTERSAATRQARTPAAGPPPPAAASPPTAPAVSANTPVTRPPPARDPAPSAETQIDAGSGATGAEQIPPAADATNVPDLAPPADPVAP
jgi:hypothetical protein